MVALHAGGLEVTCIEVIVYENPVDHSDNRLHSHPTGFHN
jgi:hypothetical protein